MGARSAALLAAGRLGAVPPAWAPAVVEQLAGPDGYDLDRVARSHGGCGLPPTAYDGRLHTVLPCGTRAVVGPDLQVGLSGPADLTPLRRLLDLDTDLVALHEAVADVLPWARSRQAGRLLRVMTTRDALVQSLAATNASYAATQRMLAAGAGPAWGYRLPALRAVLDLDLDGWVGLADDELNARVLALQGFGPFASSSVMALLGRPRPLVLDAWLRRQVDEHLGGDVAPYAALGRWGGTALWLAVSERWLYRSDGGTTPRSAAGT